MRFIIPFLLGLLAVTQAGMNRRAGEFVGIPSATLINNVVLLMATVILFVLTRNGHGPSLAPGRINPLSMMVPGLLGVLIVAGVPWAISVWGATTVFTGIMSAQIVGSMVWDLLIERQTLSGFQLSAAAVNLLSIGFLMRKG